MNLDDKKIADSIIENIECLDFADAFKRLLWKMMDDCDNLGEVAFEVKGLKIAPDAPEIGTTRSQPERSPDSKPSVKNGGTNVMPVVSHGCVSLVPEATI